jgi:cytochrome c553
MNRVLLLLILPPLATAADDEQARGTVLYRTTCAVAYCHGPEGKAGRAPGFVGRNLARDSVVRAVSSGIPNTSMPAFEKVLKDEDIEAVAAYVVSLGATDRNNEAKSGPPLKLPQDIERGRILFFDPGRMGSCGYCHEVAGRGAPVSLALRDLRTAQLDLKSVKTPAVVTARPTDEEPFPAVVAEKSDVRVRVYDLSSRLPVLRSFGPGEIALTEGAAWRHATATGLYNAGELDVIERYLRWMAAQ